MIRTVPYFWRIEGIVGTLNSTLTIAPDLLTRFNHLRCIKMEDTCTAPHPRLTPFANSGHGAAILVKVNQENVRLADRVEQERQLIFYIPIRTHWLRSWLQWEVIRFALSSRTATSMRRVNPRNGHTEICPLERKPPVSFAIRFSIYPHAALRSIMINMVIGATLPELRIPALTI
jgi:hypothetical protein